MFIYSSGPENARCVLYSATHHRANLTLVWKCYFIWDHKICLYRIPEQNSTLTFTVSGKSTCALMITASIQILWLYVSCHNHQQNSRICVFYAELSWKTCYFKMKSRRTICFGVRLHELVTWDTRVKSFLALLLWDPIQNYYSSKKNSSPFWLSAELHIHTEEIKVKMQYLSDTL